MRQVVVMVDRVAPVVVAALATVAEAREAEVTAAVVERE